MSSITRASLVLVAWGSFSALASAQEPTENSFARGELQFAESAIDLALEARGTVEEPRVRTESGFIRLWFPHMTGWMNLDLDGDGGAVRFIRVRPGADDTGVVVIRIGDGRRVPVTAIGVVRAANRVVITLPRTALPAAIEAPHAAPPAPAPVPEAAPTTVTPPAPAIADDTRTAAEALAGTEPAPAVEPTPLTLGIAPPAGGSSFLMLLGITAALAFALGAVQWMRTRTAATSNAPSIRVVASTRLSQRQQLVVVRALGQDHLIALEPGRTERLLSIPTAEAAHAMEDAIPELRLAQSAANGAPAPSFAAELLRLVDSKPQRGHAATVAAAAPPPLPNTSANSEAVAGLVRLRAAAR